ncbi:hypothetical protein ACPOLB_16095 [Rubrivivax sp. RP6-9]|uniref:hypothetical protein n=1 Tax=Rubrivivax sp. RP6-9 TaxID=3415750 RepID=UPI003CC6BE30
MASPTRCTVLIDRRPTQAREVGGKRHVQLIVIGGGADPELTALRAEVLRLGGSVRARHALVRGLTVQLPADKVAQLAARDDVASISPNRQVRRTASLLDASTGALIANVRNHGHGGYSGLDGSGVGIAVLDAGMMRAHRSFQDAAGPPPPAGGRRCCWGRWSWAGRWGPWPPGSPPTGCRWPPARVSRCWPASSRCASRRRRTRSRPAGSSSS